jgi:hypothetical protein
MSDAQTKAANPLSVKTLELSTFNRLYGGDPTAPLFVLNRSGNRAGPNKPAKQRGIILTNVTNDDNTQSIIKVPVTFIPIDLTTQAPLHSLLKSTTIKQALSLGNLVIADTASAIALMRNSKRARDEYFKLFGAEWRSPISEEGEQSDVDMTDAADEDALLNAQTEGAAASKYSDNQIVNDLILASLAGEDSDAISASILNQIDLLTAEDLNCIAQNVTDSAVKDFCLSSLS